MVLACPRARVVELAVPDAQLVERSITAHHQRVDAGALVAPDLEVLRECVNPGFFVALGHRHIVGCGGHVRGLDQQTIPDLDQAIVDRRMRNQHQRRRFAHHDRLENAGPGVPRVVEHGAGAGQRLVTRQQDLAHLDAVELVFKAHHVARSVDRFEMGLVGHVIEHFLRMARHFTQALDRPVDPVRRVVIGKGGKIVVGLAGLFVVPHPQAARALGDWPGFEAGGLGDRRG